MTTRQLSSVAQAAKEIRQQLKATYPGIKFKVQSKDYSMGSSIDIYWVNGPTETQVEAISNKKEKISRCEASGEILSGGNRFIFTHRTYSEPVLIAEVETVLKKYSGNGLVDHVGNPATAEDILIKQSDYDGTWRIDGTICINFKNAVNHWHNEVNKYVYENLKNVDLTTPRQLTVEVIAEVETTAIATVTVSENNIKNGIEIKFSTKPDQAIINELKASGFRYSRGQNLWYAPRTEDRLIVAKNLASIAEAVAAIESTPKDFDFSYLLEDANQKLSTELAEIKAEEIDSIPVNKLDDAIAETRSQVLALLPAAEVDEYLAIDVTLVQAEPIEIETKSNVIEIANWTRIKSQPVNLLDSVIRSSVGALAIALPVTPPQPIASSWIVITQ
jgi:hypothetical protein